MQWNFLLACTKTCSFTRVSQRMTSKQSLEKIYTGNNGILGGNEHNSNVPTNFLTVYFNFAFVFFCSPVRFAKDSKTGLFVSRKHLVHSALCGVVNILGVTSILSNLRGMAPFVFNQENPVVYFGGISYLSFTLLQVWTLKRSWFNQNKFLNILNFLEENKIFTMTSQKRSKVIILLQSKLFSGLICICFVIMAVYELVWENVLQKTLVWNTQVWQKLVSTARFQFFMPQISSEKGITVLDKLLVGLRLIGMVNDYILAYFASLLLLFASLTVWVCSVGFGRELGRNKSMKWSKVYTSFSFFREICQMVNESCGTLTGIYLFSSLLYQSTSLDEIIVLSDIYKRFRLIVSISTTVFTFALAADSTNQV